MNHPTFEPGPPVTEPVSPGPVAAGNASAGYEALALARPDGAAAQARWARIGLLGIGAAAILAAAILAFGSSAQPASTLAAGANGSSSTGTVEDLHGGPGGRGGFGLGHGGITITSISGSSISLATDDGWTRTISVDSGTTYTKAGADITLGDLAVGDTIGFRQTQESDGTFTIDAIAVILPRLGGEVTAVDGSTITLKQRDGGTATVNIASGAKIVVNGNAATAADIKVGMVLMAEGTKNSDGSLDATRVRAGDAGRFRGDGHGFRGGPGAPGDNDGDGPDASAAPSATDSAS
jgi:hypothetical protein